MWSQGIDLDQFLPQSWGEAGCPRKPSLLFLLLLGLGEVGPLPVSPYLEKPPWPKQKCPMPTGHSEQLVTPSNFSQILSAWE